MPGSFPSFQFTVIENLGLCVEVDEDLQTFLDRVYYVQIALCAVGILGSSVALAVYLQPSLRSSCSVQLACLSFYDIVFLLAALVMSILGLKGAWRSVAVKVLMCLRTVAVWGVAYTTLDIGLERCLSVARPFLTHCRFTVGLALKRAGGIALSGLVFTLPLVLDFLHGYSVGARCDGQRHLTTFGLVYTLYLSLLLLYLLPFSAIIVINIVFAVCLCRLRRRGVRPKGERARCQQHQHQHQHQHHHQLCVLVVGLSAWYVVSMLVPSLLFLVRLTRLELFRPQVDMRAAAVADTVVVLSCCSNFLFYFLLWRPFRQVVWGWGERAWRRVCGGWERVRRRMGTFHTGLSSSTTSEDTQPVAQIAFSPSEDTQPVAQIAFSPSVQESSH